MEQIERIKQMEHHLDRASLAVMQLSAALDQYVAAQESLHALDSYYGSDEWKKDFADDEKGLLPADLKRGVLSEDGVWNLLSDHHDLIARMQNLVKRGRNNKKMGLRFEDKTPPCPLGALVQDGRYLSTKNEISL